MPTPVLTDIDSSNLAEFPCCGIKNPSHPGLLAKRCWLKAQFNLGLRAKILLDAGRKPFGYIEYLPGEFAWRGVERRRLHVYSLHLESIEPSPAQRVGERHARSLRQGREGGRHERRRRADARRSLVGWPLSFSAKAFKLADAAPPDYELLVHKFKAGAADPAFKGDYDRKAARFGKGLTIIRFSMSVRREVLRRNCPNGRGRISSRAQDDRSRVLQRCPRRTNALRSFCDCL